MKVIAGATRCRVLMWVLGAFTTVVLTATSVGAQGAPPGGAPATGRGEGRQGRGRGIQALYPVLPIGSTLPEFSLLGIDGKRHTPQEYGKAKVLVVMFESNHCPASIAYEHRMLELFKSYQSKDVHFVAINPNNPKAVRLNELGYTDMSDSFEEMKLRAAFMDLPWPYLYDGETQALSMKMGAVATPHVFVFDQERKLQYQGAIDDSRAVAQVKQRYAANAIDELLAGRPVSLRETRALGCSTKWVSTSVAGVEEEMKAIQDAPVTMSPVEADGLRALRQNASSGKTLVVSVWNSGNPASLAQFTPLQTTFRMYAGSGRPMDLITVSTDAAAKSAAVLDFLKVQHATSRNFQMVRASEAQAALGMKWNAAQPFTLVIGPDGQVLYQKEGRIDIYEVRRVILASFPEVPSWPGVHGYYTDAVARTAAKKK